MQLIAVYARVVDESDGDLGSDELFDRGHHILAPIIKLLDACCGIPSILNAFEELLEPLMKDICNRDTEQLFEEVRGCCICTVALEVAPDDPVTGSEVLAVLLLSCMLLSGLVL